MSRTLLLNINFLMCNIVTASGTSLGSLNKIRRLHKLYPYKIKTKDDFRGCNLPQMHCTPNYQKIKTIKEITKAYHREHQGTKHYHWKYQTLVSLSLDYHRGYLVDDFVHDACNCNIIIYNSIICLRRPSNWTVVYFNCRNLSEYDHQLCRN